MGKIRKIVYSLLFIYALIGFPASRIIIEMESLKDYDDSDDTHLFI